jgi:hypothetical protein
VGDAPRQHRTAAVEAATHPAEATEAATAADIDKLTYNRGWRQQPQLKSPPPLPSFSNP